MSVGTRRGNKANGHELKGAVKPACGSEMSCNQTMWVSGTISRSLCNESPAPVRKDDRISMATQTYRVGCVWGTSLSRVCLSVCVSVVLVHFTCLVGLNGLKLIWAS